MPDQPIGPNPSGLCECGCGQRTRIATRNRAARGWVKGQPLRFVARHKGGARYRVDPVTGCWEWLWTKRGGYGRVILSGEHKFRSAHRVIWEELRGPLADDIDLHHKCENPGCVNPDHLEPLSHAQHMQRHAGLNDEAIQIIRATPNVYGAGRQLARRFGVSDNAIYDARAGRTWK